MTVRDGKLVEPCRVFAGWANANKLRAFIQNRCQPIDDGGDRLSFYLSDRGVIYYRRDREKARNILSVLRNLGTTERMRSELEQMGIAFQYPKPKELLRYLLQVGSEQDGDIVLDFFAGSGTTAQAVFEQNLQDQIGRSFILVQLPEPTGSSGTSTIADISKDRVRAVGKRIDAAGTSGFRLGLSSHPDIGFRVFKLAESNLTTWDALVPHDADALAEQLELHVDHIRDGRSLEDILYEILLKSGYPLTTPVESSQIDGKTIFSVAEGLLVVCLEAELSLEMVRAIAEKQPERVVCLDEGFVGNDQLKANAAQLFKNKDIVFRTV